MNFNNLEIIFKTFNDHSQYSISLPTYRFAQYFLILKLENFNLNQSTKVKNIQT